MRNILLFFFLTIQISGANGNTLILENRETNFYVGEFISYVQDTSNTFSPAVLHSNSELLPINRSTSKFINTGVNESTFWFWFDVENHTEEKDWILNINYPLLDDILIIQETPEGALDTLLQSGYKIKQRNDRQDVNSFFCRISLPKSETSRIFMKIKTDAYLILPVTLTTPEQFYGNERNKFLFLYSIFGIIVAAFLFNLVLYFITFDKNYLLLALFIVTLILNSFYQFGIGVKFLGTISDHFQSIIRILLFGASSIFALLYTVSWLELKKIRHLHTVFTLMIIGCGLYILLLISNIIPLRTATYISPILYLLGTIIMVYAAIFSIVSKRRSAILYLVSFGLFFISSVIWFLVLRNNIPYNFYLYHINAITSVAFCLMLTIGLVEKFNAIKSEKAHSRMLEQINTKLINEINERRQVELAMKESEAKFRLLFELSPLPIAITDYETGLFFDVNKKLCEVAGVSKENLIGKTTSELNFFSKETRLKVINHLSNRDDDNGFELDLALKNGKRLNCIIYPFLQNVKGRDMIITIISDITKVKESQQEIRKLSAAIEQSANTVIITNRKAEIEYVNPYFTRLTGYDPAEVIGKSPSFQKSGYHSAEFYSNLWKTILNGEKWIGEFYNKKKNGDFYWESSTISPIADENGNITHFLAIKEDITEKKLQQETLEKSEKRLKELNATKDKFFSIIAHDLMNPFNALQGFSHLTAESVRNEDYERALRYITMVEQLTDRITLLFQNLLLWSRAQSGKISINPTMCDVGELANETLNLLHHVAEKKNIELIIKIEHPIKTLIDQNMISTVMRNLIQNSIKFSNKDSKIELSICDDENEVHFTITDQGIGMKPEIVSELFKIDKIYSSKGTEDEVGTGLGLVICKEFIDSHNGQIWAESELGKGSKFHFSLPKSA